MNMLWWDSVSWPLRWSVAGNDPGACSGGLPRPQTDSSVEVCCGFKTHAAAQCLCKMWPHFHYKHAHSHNHFKKKHTLYIREKAGGGGQHFKTTPLPTQPAPSLTPVKKTKKQTKAFAISKGTSGSYCGQKKKKTINKYILTSHLYKYTPWLF